MNTEDGGNAADNLQFDRAEMAPQGSASSCSICAATLGDAYYTINGSIICATCAGQIAVHPPEPTFSDLARAALYGAAAALAGTCIYFAILAISGYEIGLIAVAVGWLVGKAVNKGGRSLGGWKLQTIAMALTYLSIVGSYVPLIVKSAFERTSEQPDATVFGFLILCAVLLAFALAMPFLQGLSSILGIFIIAIGLFEAWKWNRRIPLQLEGPFPAVAANT